MPFTVDPGNTELKAETHPGLDANPLKGTMNTKIYS